MIMFNQKDKLSAIIENFTQNPSISKKLQQALKDDHHPLTTQRAEKMGAWLKDPRVVLKWQKFLVPHMQLALLKRLRAYPTEWTDRPAIEKELAARGEKVL